MSIEDCIGGVQFNPMTLGFGTTAVGIAALAAHEFMQKRYVLSACLGAYSLFNGATAAYLYIADKVYSDRLFRDQRKSNSSKFL